MSLPEASRTLVEGVTTRPERVVVGSSTIASAITGSAPRAESSVMNFCDYPIFVWPAGPPAGQNIMLHPNAHYAEHMYVSAGGVELKITTTPDVTPSALSAKRFYGVEVGQEVAAPESLGVETLRISIYMFAKSPITP
uniref:Uncharacterized protein n=1 Tax=Talaromyces marneffei PM1 TaxID=1077442 RepID=A0A093V1T1_TALMA